jgi:hypothetical protein
MFDYQSLITRVSEQEFVVERQFASAAALKVAINIGMLQGMSITWDYLGGYVQELQAK